MRHTGLVFPCCQLEINEQNAIGNILTDDIQSIINGPKIREMRQQSIEERLPCYENCEQVKTFESYPIPKPTTDLSDFSIYADLQIEYGELCNVDCVMCWQDRTNTKVIPYEALKEKVPLEAWKMITVYGGEVFVMKDAMKHIHDILDLGLKNLTIITNGRALANEALAEKIIKNAYSVIVSINAATQQTHDFVMRPRESYFPQLIRSIQNLQTLKAKHDRYDFRINANFCGLKETLHEVPMVIENFQSFGFDTLSVTFDHRDFPGYFHKNPRMTKALASKIDSTLNSVGPEVSKWVKVADYGLFELKAPHGHP